MPTQTASQMLAAIAAHQQKVEEFNQTPELEPEFGWYFSPPVVLYTSSTIKLMRTKCITRQGWRYGGSKELILELKPTARLKRFLEKQPDAFTPAALEELLLVDARYDKFKALVSK